MTSYLLSWPPSTNALWRSFRGRNILSSQARSWMKSADLELMSQRARPVKGIVEIDIELASPTKRKFDPDNRVKALLDLLVRNKVIEADDNSILKKFSVTVDGQGFTGARITIRKAPA